MPVLAPAAESVRSDLALLQGVWTSVAGTREARFLIAGHRFTFEFADGELYMGTLAVTPGRMDMHIEEGPARHVGLVTRCLYSLDGGVLRWCPGKPGADRRPVDFPSVDDPKHLSLVFRKATRK